MIDPERLAELGVDINEVTVIDRYYNVRQLDGGEWKPAPLPKDSIFGRMGIKPRILIFTPAHPRYGVRPQTMTSVHAAIRQYAGPVEWVISNGDNPLDKPYANVARHHNRAREMVLSGDYDALLSVEADMIIPPDTIDRLLACDSDVAYGLYTWRYKPHRWSAYEKLDLWGGASISCDPTGKEARAAWGRIMDVAGLGMGCTLIRRSALGVVGFRLHDGRHSWIQEEYGDQFAALGFDPYRKHEQMVADDWLLAMDAQHHGLSQRANLAVVCGHITDDGIIWPDPNAGQLYRIETLEE